MEQNKVFGLDISELEYRRIPLPSYSLLSDIQKLEENLPGSGKTIVGGVSIGDMDMDGLIFGTIVDQILSDGKPSDDIIVLKKKPSGKMKDMIKMLIDVREFLPDPNDILSPMNSQGLLDIAEEYNYKKKDADRINGFMNYKEYIDVYSDENNNNKIITTSYIFNTALKIANEMLSSFPLLSFNYTEDHIEIHRQIKLTGMVNNVMCKGMMDLILINHKGKFIVPIDIKTGANRLTDFEEKGYFGWNYYIQSYLYKVLLKDYIDKNYPELKDYEIRPFSFIFGDRIKGGVIRYDVTEENDLLAGDTGFINKNKKSVNDLLQIYYDNKPSGYDDYINTL